MQAIPDRGFTHGGVFHADDVFSAALLTILNPSITISRGFELPDDFVGLVFDIGGGPFDHHGPCREQRVNGVPYASFGLIWRQYGTLLLDTDDASAFDESFVQPIDDADNGGKPCMLSQLVSDFNPASTDELAAYDEAFKSAVAWARDVLQRRLDAILLARESRDYVSRCMDNCDGHVLILDKLVPWRDVASHSGYEFVVYPSIRGGYNVQSVAKSVKEGKPSCLFPPSWRGKDPDALKKVSGVNNITFCHPSGFLVAAEGLEGAVQAARLAMES